MDLISMKKPVANNGNPNEDYDKPAYSYGLCISLGADELAALGINALPEVGTEVMVHAMAYVKTVSARENQDGSDMSMELQITDMMIGAHDMKHDKAAKGLYGEDGETESSQAPGIGSAIADALYS